MGSSLPYWGTLSFADQPGWRLPEQPPLSGREDEGDSRERKRPLVRYDPGGRQWPDFQQRRHRLPAVAQGDDHFGFRHLRIDGLKSSPGPTITGPVTQRILHVLDFPPGGSPPAPLIARSQTRREFDITAITSASIQMKKPWRPPPSNSN